MAGEATTTEIEKQILRSLREFYPLKVDEVVLISAIQKSGKDESIDQISENIRPLIDENWIEESVVKAPFGGAKTHRFKITSSGIEHLHSVDRECTRDLSVPLAEIESRLMETCNHIMVDMENMRQDLEDYRKMLEGSVEGVSKRMAGLSEELASVKELVDRHVGKADDERIREEILILRILSGDEKTIYDIILNSGGEVLQKDLVIKTKMSNSKVSRTVDHLESRGVLAKERHGATNRLKIMISPR